MTTKKQVPLAELIESIDSLGGVSNRPEDVAIRDAIRRRPMPEQDAIALELEPKATGTLAGNLLSRLAQDEAAAIKSARLNGQPIPAKPFLEALTRRNAEMTSIKSKKQAGVPTSSGGTRTSKASGVTFTHDGKPVSATQNKLSSVAWFYTQGLGADGGRLKVGELKALLAANGVADPHQAGWAVKLDNGITIGCVAEGATIPPVEKQPKLSTSKPKTSTTKSTATKAAKTAKKSTASATAAAKTATKSKTAKATKTAAAKRSKPTSASDAGTSSLASLLPGGSKPRGQGATKPPSKLAPRNPRGKTAAKV